MLKLSLSTLLIVLAIFSLLFAVEKVFPLRESRGGLLARLIVNAVLSCLALAIAALAMRPMKLSFKPTPFSITAICDCPLAWNAG